MVVRCGRCQIELEVPGAGEFVCPSCGTRNVVRGSAPAAPSPFGVADLGATAPAPPDAAPDVRWIRCPTCAYRFVVGDVATAPCPSCSAALNIDDTGVSLAE